MAKTADNANISSCIENKAKDDCVETAMKVFTKNNKNNNLANISTCVMTCTNFLT